MVHVAFVTTYTDIKFLMIFLKVSNCISVYLGFHNIVHAIFRVTHDSLSILILLINVIIAQMILA